MKEEKMNISNRKKATIFGIVAVVGFALMGITLMGIIITSSPAPQEHVQDQALASTLEKSFGAYSKNLPSKHPPPSPLSMYGQTTSMASAKQLSGMGIKAPTYVPTDLELKMVKTRVDPAGPLRMVTLIYAPAPSQIDINEESTAENVMDFNGLIVVYTKELPGTDIAKFTDEYTKNTPGAHSVTVHGSKAIGFNGDPATGKKSQVIFYDGDIQVILFSVPYQEAELLKIAESMQ